MDYLRHDEITVNNLDLSEMIKKPEESCLIRFGLNISSCGWFIVSNTWKRNADTDA